MSMPPAGQVSLERWHAYHVWCDDLIPKRYKYCLCVCPLNEWFFFISSTPSPGRQQRQFDVAIQNFEAVFLRHTSYLDTSKVITFQDARVAKALASPRDRFGRISPTLQARIVALVQTNPALTTHQKSVILTVP